jgi:hypothetical protein
MSTLPFGFGSGSNPIKFYKDANSVSLSTILGSQIPQLDNHWNNISFNRSSAQKQDEAKIQRFNCGVAFDVYAPQISHNANVSIHQAKNNHEQTFHTQISSINRWTRAQNINVLMGENNYRYIESQDFIGAGIHVDHISKNESYADYYRLQVGQSTKLPISLRSKVGSKYGIFELGAINDVKFTSRDKSISLDAKVGIGNMTDGTFNVDAKKGFHLESLMGGVIKTGGELLVNSTGPNIMGSSTLMALNSGGPIYIDAPVVYVGMSATLGGRVNLDAVTSNLAPSFIDSIKGSLSNVLGSVVGGTLGDIVGDLPIVSAAGALANGNFSSFMNATNFMVDGAIGSGFSNMVLGAVQDAGGDFLTGTVGNVVGGVLSDGLDSLLQSGGAAGVVDALTGGVTGVLTDAVNDVIPGFSDILNGDLGGALNSVLDATGLLNNIPGADAFFGLLSGGSNGFKFKTYPSLTPLDYYNSAPVPKSQPQINYGVDTENIFPTFFSISSVEPEPDTDYPTPDEETA